MTGDGRPSDGKGSGAASGRPRGRAPPPRPGEGGPRAQDSPLRGLPRHQTRRTTPRGPRAARGRHSLRAARGLGTTLCSRTRGRNKASRSKRASAYGGREGGGGRACSRAARGARAAAMSDIVERTLTALPALFLQTQPGGGPAAAKAPFSSRLGGLVRGLTALTSKHVGAGREAGPGGEPGAGRGGPGERRTRGREVGPGPRGRGPLRTSFLPSGSALFAPGQTREAEFPPTHSDPGQVSFPWTLCVSQRWSG